MLTLVAFFACFATAPAEAITTQQPLGQIRDGDFHAAISLSVVNAAAGKGAEPGGCVLAVRIAGQQGTHSLWNPFIDRQLASPCHLIIYDEECRLIDVVVLGLNERPKAGDSREQRLLLSSDRAFGRFVDVPAAVKETRSKTSKRYAQAIFFEKLLRPGGSAGDITKVATMDDYRTVIRGRVIGATKPIGLDERSETSFWNEAFSANGKVVLHLETAKPAFSAGDRVGVLVGMANLSQDDIYVAPNLFLGVRGSPRSAPDLDVETVAGERIGSVINATPVFEKKPARRLCRLPPRSFLEGRTNFIAGTTPGVGFIENRPAFVGQYYLRFQGVPAFVRREPDKATDITAEVEWPPTWGFEEITTIESNPVKYEVKN